MLEINLLLTLLCIWLFMFLNNKFLKVARTNKIRYQLFALRDELAILAMKGAITPEGMEYLTLRDMINGSIKALGSFSIVRFVRFSVSLYRDQDLQKRLDKILVSLARHENREFRDIVFKYFNIMHTTFGKNIRLFMRVLLPIMMVIAFPLKVLKNMFKERAETLRTVNMYFEEKANQIGHFSTA